MTVRLAVGAPPVLHLLDGLMGTSDRAPDDETIRRAEGLLRRGAGTSTTSAPLGTLAAGLADLEWFRLTEAAGGDHPDQVTARCAAVFSALAALGTQAAVTVGADEAGRAGVAVGLPRGSEAVGVWLSGQAPDLVWEPGTPPGWSVVVDPEHVEQTLTGRPVDVPGPVAAPSAEHGLPLLSHLLTVSVDRWCLVIVIAPVPRPAVIAVHDRLSGMAAAAARRLTRSEAFSETLSQSVTDPRADSLVRCLEAWTQLLEDCLQAGGWRIGVHVCAATEAGLAAAGAAAAWAMTPETAGSPPGRRQSWDLAPGSEGGDFCFGWVSSKELGSLLVPPREAVGDLQIRRSLPAGRHDTARGRRIDLGHWLGTDLPATIGVEDLSGHAFVAGITGSGKSTTTDRLLLQLWNTHGIPFLVIDPAKSDHERLASQLIGGVRVVSGAQLRANALAPWPGAPASRHIARVGGAFRGAFGMPVPVPYVAALLLEQLGAEAELGSTVTLHDAAARLDGLVADLGYQGDIEDNIRASLGLRLRMLLQPERAERVAGAGPPVWLTDRPTLVQLSDLGDEEERAFLAALLVLWIADAARERGESTQVRHVTVVEEAHRLMPEPRPASGDEGSAAAVAAQLFTNLLAEVRAYGEALVVVDQSPAAVAREVLRNTNLKLAHRVVESADQASLGGALGLPPEETAVLGSLTTGRCLVSSRSLIRPQTVQVPPPVPPAGPAVVLGPPAAPDTRCHRGDDALHHHVSESRGVAAELAVALWIASPDPRDLLDLLRPVAAEDVRIRVSCLFAVGLRRHVATLRRLGHLAPETREAFEDEAWRAFLSRLAPPVPDGRPAVGPFTACRACPVPCRARPVIASGALRPLRAARTAAARARGAAEIVEAALAAAEDCRAEHSPDVGEAAATGVGFCLAVHVARETGSEQVLLRTASAEVEPGL